MKINKILSLISGVMLLLAIPSIWPYGYYQLLRWIISVTGVFNAYKSYESRWIEWSVIMIVVTILFNPLAPVTFEKGVWAFIDIVIAIVMFMIASKFKDIKTK